MSRQTKYPPELRERAIRMVYEQHEHHESQWAAIESVVQKISCAAFNGSRHAIAGKRQRRQGGGAVALVSNRCLGDLASDPNHHQTLLVKCPETGQQTGRPCS